MPANVQTEEANKRLRAQLEAAENEVQDLMKLNDQLSRMGIIKARPKLTSTTGLPTRRFSVYVVYGHHLWVHMALF